MTFQDRPRVARRSPGAEGERIVTLAILAVGGQGGGVLTGWITAVAEASGWHAQSTSVAGVAQRTGATIYYVEMCRDTGRVPVFALSPSEGDVDVLMAAEAMEAGRAVTRGFVTPGRTTVIASTHRIAAVSEKVAPGDGAADRDAVMAAVAAAADQLVAFDMETVAREAGSVISASLLGALAGSGALPFERARYEDVVRASGRGVEASLRAFAAAHDCTTGARPAPQPVPPTAPDPRLRVPERLAAGWSALTARADALPDGARAMARRGLVQVVDYQDLDYGAAYLSRVEAVVALDAAPHAMTEAAAKYVARALCYDDLPRVADLKTRADRFARIRAEMTRDDGQVMRLTEYFHPRWEEALATMPAPLGRWLAARDWPGRAYARWFGGGRRIRSDRLPGFLTLWAVASLRPWRRRLMRHATEMAHVDAWFGHALRLARSDRALAAEVLANYRLVKGYSDTHARGMSKFARVMGALPVLEGRADAADWMRRLRVAALADADGAALDGALATVASFAGDARDRT